MFADTWLAVDHCTHSVMVMATCQLPEEGDEGLDDNYIQACARITELHVRSPVALHQSSGLLIMELRYYAAASARRTNASDG